MKMQKILRTKINRIFITSVISNINEKKKINILLTK